MGCRAVNDVNVWDRTPGSSIPACLYLFKIFYFVEVLFGLITTACTRMVKEPHALSKGFRIKSSRLQETARL